MARHIHGQQNAAAAAAAEYPHVNGHEQRLIDKFNEHRCRVLRDYRKSVKNIMQNTKGVAYTAARTVNPSLFSESKSYDMVWDTTVVWWFSQLQVTVPNGFDQHQDIAVANRSLLVSALPAYIAKTEDLNKIIPWNEAATAELTQTLDVLFPSSAVVTIEELNRPLTPEEQENRLPSGLTSEDFLDAVIGAQAFARIRLIQQKRMAYARIDEDLIYDYDELALNHTLCTCITGRASYKPNQTLTKDERSFLKKLDKAAKAIPA